MTKKTVAAGAALLLCFGVGAGTLTANADEHSGEGDLEWPYYGSAPGGGRYSPAEQINASNLNRLKQVWEHRSGDYRTGELDSGLEFEEGMAARPTTLMVTPIMLNDTVYYCTPYNRVFALDPQTGAEKWSFDPGVDMSREGLTNCRGVSSWSRPDPRGEPCDHRIVMGTLDARIVVLDAETGKRCPDFAAGHDVDLTVGLSPHKAIEYSVTSPPAIIGNTLVTGAMVADSQRNDVPSGVVRAYDVLTGEFLWGWNSVAPGHPAVDASGNFVAGTTNVWSVISVDPALGLVYVPTGNSSPDYYGGDRQGHLDYYSSSVVALDANTGEVVWHFQTVHHDIWDYDVPAQPVLVDLTIDGETVPALVQVTKMGMTFVLNRRTGEPLFPVEERPVPQTGAVPGEYLSPTQPFPVKPEPLDQLGISPDDAWGLTFWDEGRCREQLESLTTGPIYTPPSLTGTVVFPSPLGGNNWGAPAVDPERKIMVANTKHLPIVIRLAERRNCPENAWQQVGSPYCVILEPLVSPLGIPCTEPPWATLAAVDLTTGAKLWQVPFATAEEMAPWPFSLLKWGIDMGGAMVTRAGLVFIGSASDRYLRAFDIETGEELWKDKLPTTANAVPMSYTSGGRQFVLVAAGGHWTSEAPAGDHLIAYALED
ncbi:MAG: pyrroloquinoline quinone-dependent dehydrogenase [Pseudomonadales bacterium]|jgi:quinoprotein glucose dehydrogenase